MGDCYCTTDGYQPYHNLPENITVTGCMAHYPRSIIIRDNVAK
ncbi:MAG: hypothetical protein MR332_07530 [Fusicatenibacter sp.]|nr:hypothetical protein [Fusicatenibacter sp.]